MTDDQPSGEHDNRTVPVVISGSFKKAPDLLAQEYNALRKDNCQILSPANVKIVDEHDGFVIMEGEEDLTPKAIEDRHLRAIQQSEFIWFHAPEGYIGLSGAFEVGFALANGVPVYSDTEVNDETLKYYINRVDNPEEARREALLDPVRIPSALRSMQKYYERVTKNRGHADEDEFDCIEFLKEEVQELDRALQTNRNYPGGNEAGDRASDELADVFLYTVHMANLLGIDLTETVKQKENINRKRFSPDINDR